MGPPIQSLARWTTLVGTLAGAAAIPLAQPGPPASPQTQAPAQPGRGGVAAQGAEPDLPLVARFDRNGDHRLDRAERDAARDYLAANPGLRKPTRGSQLPRGGSVGPVLAPKDVRTYPPSVSLYDANTVRTLFLQFADADWEQELEAFYHTDVLVPATLVVDNRSFPDVGVSFRGNNSFGNVAAGLKRPLSIAMDWARDQHLLGYRSLNLLNANQDPTFLRSVLYLDVARDYIPALRANFTRVAINGESWGLYVNQQTFGREAERELFKSSGGTLWKSPNNSSGGGFSYLGEDIAPYRRWYEMKGADNLAAWRSLVQATKILNGTPPDQLERALAPVMDIDAVLRFLALDIALANGDGYWNDGSDFNVYLTAAGRFVLTPHDANEGFRARGANGAQPDPLVNLTDPNKALRHKLLAVPALRDRYLRYIADIAEKWLDWNRLGALVDRYRAMIADDVARDTRKHETAEAFMTGIYGAEGAAPVATTLKGYAEIRRAVLLAHPEITLARQRR